MERGDKEENNKTHKIPNTGFAKSNGLAKWIKVCWKTYSSGLLCWRGCEVEIKGSGDLYSDVEHTETSEDSKIVFQVKTLYTSKVLPMQAEDISISTRFNVTSDGFDIEVTSSDLRS